MNGRTSAAATYVNNLDDRQLEASFSIECP